MGQGMSTSFPHSTSNSQGNRSFAFDYDYYASDNKTATIKWVGAGDGTNSFGIDFTPTPILQYYNVYLEDSSTGLTHGPVRIEKDWPLYASFSGLSSTVSGYTFLVDAVYGKPATSGTSLEDGTSTINVFFDFSANAAQSYDNTYTFVEIDENNPPSTINGISWTTPSVGDSTSYTLTSGGTSVSGWSYYQSGATHGFRIEANVTQYTIASGGTFTVGGSTVQSNEGRYEAADIMFTHRLSVGADTLANFAAATGDPYLTTFTGDIYKLPNDNHTYRMIDNFTSTGTASERFFINTQMYLLPDNKQAWLDHYLQLANRRPEYKKYFDQNPEYIENARAIGGSFMKTSRIQLGEEYVEFDMETLELTDYSNDYSNVFSFTEELPIETGLEATHSIDAYTHEAGSFRCVRFNTTTHGEVIAKLFTFANPQLRTAINIGSPVRFEATNSHGALLCPQRADNIRVACLDSSPSISAPEASPFYRLFQETFIKNGDVYQIQMVDCE